MCIAYAAQFLAIAFGILAGLSVVYVFNRIPAAWLCDYNEEPDKGMWGTRIQNRPFDALFALAFAAASFKMLDEGFLYLPAGIAALWTLLIISISDIKYRIIPDQFVIILAAVGLGFIPFQDTVYSPLCGALTGGGSAFLIGAIGRLIYKKDTLGFGDIKLFGAAGLVAGFGGTVYTLLFAAFSSAVIFTVRLLMRQIKLKDEQPLGPFIAAGAATYILFREETGKCIDWLLALVI